ncbi:MAG TPA: ATP-binding protein, partial [Hyphomicrobiales bacterium]|nr:ATP-binding protein [Hyphomicrobiales bacterium]
GTFIADAKRVTQVLFNLIANAINYTRAGSRVRVSCARQGDDVVLSVSDEGPGIAPELQKMIFERFESHGEGAGQRGAGLGLAVVKSLVELHGGEVRLDSRPGQGTTVTCVFPISPDVARSRPHRPQPAEEPLPRDKDSAARADG